MSERGQFPVDCGIADQPTAVFDVPLNVERRYLADRMITKERFQVVA
ncbi:MAG: hypothetical protein H6970_08050 [Gammaproteobacteria bacterium]|nr:hypothetical protein [Gammaproteobacteria bacterium]MCP5458018.1 hypothetical protein [Gammaproteobacteria bacterium]